MCVCVCVCVSIYKYCSQYKLVFSRRIKKKTKK